jgi:hypothetical protein
LLQLKDLRTHHLPYVCCGYVQVQAGTGAAHQRAQAVHVAAEKVKVTGVTVKSARLPQKAQPGSSSSSSSSNGILSAFNALYSPLNG